MEKSRSSLSPALLDSILIVFAMPSEEQGLLQKKGARVVFTGLGKVNASYVLMRAISERRPKFVLNFGTAGSATFPTHSVVECTSFLQRDMDLSPLGFQIGLTPFESIPKIISVLEAFQGLPKTCCGTGDSFEVGALKVPCDVVDMEAYALAKICLLENLPFACVKYITDGSDENAHKDWQANLPKAALAFAHSFATFTDFATSAIGE